MLMVDKREEKVRRMKMMIIMVDRELLVNNNEIFYFI
jgi:hypothetical protein